MSSELLRRLSILEEKKVPQVNARMMRGGMQDRLRRQEVIRFSKSIENKKRNIKKRLELEQEKKDGFGIQSFTSQSVESLDDFNEPILRRIRSKRGFF